MSKPLMILSAVFFLYHLPKTEIRLHLVIASRSEPSLDLHKLRVRAQLTELRAADLRFSYQETGAFLCQVLGFMLKQAVEYKPQGQQLAASAEVSHNAGTNAFTDFLSKREEEDMGLLSFGLSNKEISQTLFIEVGMVKQHLKNIYSKFDVHNRIEAVYFAREAGILL
jgi:ATP/maltotriose-dependent transcriptional regulator MalT